MDKTRSRLTFLTSFFILLLSTFGTTKSLAQKNYFYGSIKLPEVDYVIRLISKESSSAKPQGSMFDFGYGVAINNNLLFETGVEAFVYHPLNVKYYRPDMANGNFFDSENIIRELDVMNAAIALQLRPVWRLDINEKTRFRAACAVNFQQLFSTGDYYINDGEPGTITKAQKLSASTKSPFHIGFQPLIGVDYKLSDNLGLGFDLKYVNLNWNKSLEKMYFGPLQDQQIPSHQTSSIFLSGRIFF